MSTLNQDQLDSLRVDIMRALLKPELHGRIGAYDITSRKLARSMAIDDQNYDAMQAARDNADAEFCLTGPGIEDTYFRNMPEFLGAVFWACAGFGDNATVSLKDAWQNVRDLKPGQYCMAVGDGPNETLPAHGNATA
jgi:hypothetical protein